MCCSPFQLSSQTSAVQKYLSEASLANNCMLELNQQSYDTLNNSNNLVRLTYSKEEIDANEYHKVRFILAVFIKV